MVPRYEPPGEHPADPSMDRSYFFDDGIHFQCTECGECCRGAPGQVYVSGEEIQRLAAETGCTPEAFVASHCRPIPGGFSLLEKENGECIFLENDRCRVHHCKPMQCATFPFWTHNLRSEARWLQTCRHCEGIGQGRLYTREDILRILNHQTSAVEPHE